MILTALQIFEYMRGAGFSVLLAIVMTAIALRESAGSADAFNDNAKTGDRSYGLLQINCLELGARALTLFGIDDEKQLLDPATNAHAGLVLWGGKNSNLDECWYLNRPVYQQRYEAHLPAAIAAALASPLGV
jgi:lysozyme-like protein